MTTIKCRYCGGSVTLTEAGHGYCDYCGQELTLPSRQEERVLAMYERAAHFRARGEFDRAYSAYQHLVEENPKDPELHWCMTLCRYGVEYVEDNRLSDAESGIREYKPTMSRMSFEPVLEDPDYQAALACSDETGRRLYRQEAGKLDRIQRRYLDIIRKEEPYDVFISFQSDEADGSRTKASVLGQEIYEQLTGKGLKVFFSRITLERVQGQEYEPYIFAALQTSRVMLLIADNKEQLQGRWVMNEWSRFLAMMEEDRGKSLIPVFNSRTEAHMSPYDFPDKIATTQAQDMAKLGAMQDLVRGVCKLTGHEEASRTVVIESGVTLDNLLRRADIALKDREFQEAEEMVGQALDMDAENAQAHLYRLLLHYRVSNLRELMDIQLDWSRETYFLRAKRYAGDRQGAELARFEEDCRKEEILRQAKAAADSEAYDKALHLLKGIEGYQGAAELANRCDREFGNQIQLERYRHEMGDGSMYLSRRFASEYPLESKQWERLKEKAETKPVNGGIFAFICAAASMAVALAGIRSYGEEYINEISVNQNAFLWGLLCGGVVWKCSQEEQKSFGILFMAGIVFTLIGVGTGRLYNWNSALFFWVPYVMTAVSAILFFLCIRLLWKQFSRKAAQEKMDQYFLSTIIPAEHNLRMKVEDEWAGRIDEENRIELSPIK